MYELWPGAASFNARYFHSYHRRISVDLARAEARAPLNLIKIYRAGEAPPIDRSGEIARRPPAPPPPPPLALLYQRRKPLSRLYCRREERLF